LFPEPVVEDAPELPVVLLPEVPVASEPLIVPDWPLELPRLRRERDRVVVELLFELLFEFWSIVVLDWPVCDALDWPVGLELVALAPESEL
jgi:hypothetical protein